MTLNGRQISFELQYLRIRLNFFVIRNVVPVVLIRYIFFIVQFAIYLHSVFRFQANRKHILDSPAEHNEDKVKLKGWKGRCAKFQAFGERDHCSPCRLLIRINQEDASSLFRRTSRFRSRGIFISDSRRCCETKTKRIVNWLHKTGRKQTTNYAKDPARNIDSASKKESQFSVHPFHRKRKIDILIENRRERERKREISGFYHVQCD